MTHLEDLNRIEIRHLRDTVNVFESEIRKLRKLLKTIKEENETLRAKNELHRQKLESEYRKSKV
jgi:regulator of replication initiation timing